MLKIDKQTKKELIIYTSPSCGFCAMLHESGKCGDMPLTRILVLSQHSKSEETVNKVIFKAHKPMEVFKKLLLGQDIDDSEIDWSKDVSKELKENLDMQNQLLAKFNLQGTPSFIIKDGDNLQLIEPPQPDVGALLLKVVEDYI